MSYHDRDDRREPPLPKPYGFVPLPRAAVTTTPAGHDRFKHLTGTLSLTLLARSPVHIASGLLQQIRDQKYPLVKAHFRVGDRPAIPATSLKGCIRAIVEAISPSTVTVTRARPIPGALEPQKSERELDVAQRIFGALGYQGHVAFGDALLEQGQMTIVPTPQLFRPRTEAAQTYYDGRWPKGRKFYMHGKLTRGDLPLEACQIESRFSCRADFSGLTRGELGLLLLALGLGKTKLWPKLGGGKPACLGTIEVTDVRLETLDMRASYEAFDVVVEPMLDLDSLIQAAWDAQLVLKPQLDRLAELLRWPREDRDCPGRSY